MDDLAVKSVNGVTPDAFRRLALAAQAATVALKTQLLASYEDDLALTPAWRVWKRRRIESMIADLRKGLPDAQD